MDNAMSDKNYKLVYDRKSGKDKRVYLKSESCRKCERSFRQKRNYNYKECPKCRKNQK